MGAAGRLLGGGPAGALLDPSVSSESRVEAFSDGVLAIVITIIVDTWAACAIYAAVAGIWFVPDRRVERELRKQRTGEHPHDRGRDA